MKKFILSAMAWMLLFHCVSATGYIDPNGNYDLNRDKYVDLRDFAVLGADWSAGYDVDDLNSLCSQWLYNQPAVRIACIGDSITQGRGAAPALQSWRYPFWKKLIDSHVNFDLVGSIQTGFSGDPVWPDYKGRPFDRDHEGHWGWPTDGIRDNLPTWLTGYTPDIALVMLGTNDFGQGNTVAQIKEEMRGIVDILRADNPNVAIIIGQPYQEWESYPALAAAYADLAAEEDEPNSPVDVVAHGPGWISAASDPCTHTADWVHPNASGELKLAHAWLKSINPYVRFEITNQDPVGWLKANPPSGTAPLYVTFGAKDAYDPDGSIAVYGWDFGDGSNRTSGKPGTHTYANPGTYTVIQGVTDNEGATGVATTTVTVY